MVLDRRVEDLGTACVGGVLPASWLGCRKRQPAIARALEKDPRVSMRRGGHRVEKYQVEAPTDIRPEAATSREFAAGGPTVGLGVQGRAG